MKISDLYQNRFAQFFYKKTEKPILRSMDWCGRHVGLTVFLLLLVGMGLRIAYRGMVDRPERDEITYLSWVEKLATSDVSVTPWMHRTLSYVGLAIDRLGFEVEWGLRCFNFVCSFLWLFLMYLLGKAAFSSPKAGLVCLTLAVFNPYAIRMAGQIMREPLYLLVFSAGLFCAIQIVRGVGVLRYAFLLAPLTVLGWWNRDEGFEMLLLLPLAVIFHGFSIRNHQSEQSRPWRRLAAGVMLYLLALGISVASLLLACPGVMDAVRQNAELNYNRIFSSP